MTSVRQHILHAATTLGVERDLRTVQRAFESSTRRRNRRDDENLLLLLAAVLTPGANCIDVGANIGTTLRCMCRVAPSGKHIAYEPLPALCQQLRSAFPTVDVRQTALSNHIGEEDFVHVKHLPSRSGLRRPDYRDSQTETLRTKVDTLDSTLAQDYIPALIKIDVEGAELQVLEGAKETIARHQPIIVFEHDVRWAAHYDSNPHDFYTFLRDTLNLQVFDMDGNGPFTISRFTQIARERTRWNFFARSYPPA
jgi:FkbM family methyltransferase